MWFTFVPIQMYSWLIFQLFSLSKSKTHVSHFISPKLSKSNDVFLAFVGKLLESDSTGIQDLAEQPQDSQRLSTFTKAMLNWCPESARNFDDQCVRLCVLDLSSSSLFLHIHPRLVLQHLLDKFLSGSKVFSVNAGCRKICLRAVVEEVFRSLSKSKVLILQKKKVPVSVLPSYMMTLD